MARAPQAPQLDGRSAQLCDELTSLENQDFVEVVTAALHARPDLAFSVVEYAIPDLTFPPLRAISFNRYTGIMKSYNQLNGYGFISCRAIEQIFGCDVFVHASQFAGQGAGDQVDFAVFLNQDQKPQAFDIMDLSTAAAAKGKGKGLSQVKPPVASVANLGLSNGLSKGLSKGLSSKGQGKGQLGAASRSKTAAAPQAGVKRKWNGDEEFEGVVKMFNEAAGRGFISCTRAKQLYGEDVYVHANVLMKSGASVGDTVRFGIHVNKEGKPQAQAPMQLLQRSSRQESDGEVHSGRIKSFNAKTGYGFVECPETKALYGRDVYLSEAQAGDCKEVGIDVCFHYRVSNDGNPIVTEIWPAGF